MNDQSEKAHTRIYVLTEGAVMVALSFALSFIGYEMPMGGRVTPASMLPLMLFALRSGPLAALLTGGVYSLLQCMQALVAGNVFPYCETAPTLILCILFDYVIPFTLPFVIMAVIPRAVSHLRHPDSGYFDGYTLYIGVVVGLLLRFICHFISGVLIWSQWAEDLSPAVYSLVYNGSFMLPELILTCLLLFFLCHAAPLRERLYLAPRHR